MGTESKSERVENRVEKREVDRSVALIALGLKAYPK